MDFIDFLAPPSTHRFSHHVHLLSARSQHPVNESCTVRRCASFCKAVRSLQSTWWFNHDSTMKYEVHWIDWKECHICIALPIYVCGCASHVFCDNVQYNQMQPGETPQINSWCFPILLAAYQLRCTFTCGISTCNFTVYDMTCMTNYSLRRMSKWTQKFGLTPHDKTI